jgi:hypothetical protein
LGAIKGAHSFAGKNMMRHPAEVREQMFSMIEQWQQSGLTQKAFCERQSLKYHTFYYWYKCYRRQNPVEVNAGSFVKLQIAKPSFAASVEINYPGGVRLVFHEPVSAIYLKVLLG